MHKAKEGNQSGVLKKLDRVMANNDFITKYPQCHAIFHPYIISDHSPATLCIPTSARKNAKVFRFANFTADNVKFIDTMKKVWEENVDGVYMF